MPFTFGPRRGVYIDILDEMKKGDPPLSLEETQHFERFDLIYRSLCAMLFNYVPTSGHPGGSISSGRFVMGLLFDALDYDVSKPDREDADIISYAAGHKALGLYSLWALRNEVLRIGKPDLLPARGTRSVPTGGPSGISKKSCSKNVSHQETTCEGTGWSSHACHTLRPPFHGRLRRWLGKFDRPCPGRHGSLWKRCTLCPHCGRGRRNDTGRVSEALAAAGTASLKNVILHVDWNQASIDSNRVCREGEVPGDYVQWNPMELTYLHDWNVIWVPEGRDFHQILAAQRKARRWTTVSQRRLSIGR